MDRIDTNGDGVRDANDDIYLGGEFTQMFFSNSDNYLYIVNNTDSKIVVIDTTTYSRVDTNGDGISDNNDDISVGGSPNYAELTWDDSLLMIATSNSGLTIIDTTTYSRVDTNGDGISDNNDDVSFDGNTDYRGLAINEDASIVYVLNRDALSITTINTGTYQRMDTNNDGVSDSSDELYFPQLSAYTRYPEDIAFSNDFQHLVFSLSYNYNYRYDYINFYLLDTSSYSIDSIPRTVSDNGEVVFTPDSTKLLMSDEGNYQIKVYNIEDDNIQTIHISAGNNYDLQSTSDSRYLYLRRSISGLILIDLYQGIVLNSSSLDRAYNLKIHNDQVFSSNYANNTIDKHDFSVYINDYQVSILDEPSSFYFSPDYEDIYVQLRDSDSLQIFDSETLATRQTSRGEGEFLLGFTPDETDFFTDRNVGYVLASDEDSILPFDTDTYSYININGDDYADGSDKISLSVDATDLYILPDNSYALVHSYRDSSFVFIDPDTHTVDHSVLLPVSPYSIKLNNSGDYIGILQNNSTNKLYIYDIELGGLIDFNEDGYSDNTDYIETPIYISGMEFSNNGEYIYLYNYNPDYYNYQYQYSNNNVVVIDTATWSVVDLNNDNQVDASDTISTGYGASGVFFTPNDEYAFITKSQRNTDRSQDEWYYYSIIDVSTHSNIANVYLERNPSYITFDPQGNYAYVGINGTTPYNIENQEFESVIDHNLYYGWIIEGNQYPYYTSSQIVQTLTAADQSTLDYDAGSDTYTRVYPSGTQVHFNTDGTHDYTQDKNGNRTSYTYNSDGTVETLTQTPASETAAALTWTFNYTNGELSSIQNPSGVTTLATVEDGQLTELENADGYAREFSYDNENLLLSETLENGDTRSFRYDELGKVEALIQPTREVVDASGNVTTSQEVVQYEPASTAAAINSSDVSISTTRSAPAQATSESNIVATTTYPGSNAVQRTFNQYGAPTSTTDALGRTTTYTYDSENNLQQISYPEGNAVSYTYNDDGYPTSVTQLATSTDTTGLTTTYTYEDSYNQVKTATDANGNTTTYFYDYEFDTDSDGGFDADDDEYSTYEAAYVSQGSAFAGNVWKVEQPSSDVYSTSSFTSATQTPTLYFTWNANGQLLSAVDQNGATTAQTYATARSVLESISLDSTGENFTTTFANFNSFGKPESVTDARGNTRSLSYNANDGLPTGETVTVDVDQDGTQESIAEWRAYNSLNQLTTTVYDSGGVDQLTEQATRLHDGQPIYEVQLDSNNYTTYTTITYDELRRPALVTDANGDNTFYQYDAEGQLTSMVQGWTSANTAGEYQESYSYDNNGNRTAVTYADGTQDRFTYDSYGRVSSEVRNYVETDPTEDQNITTSYGYDDAGNVTSVTAPDGVVTQYTYDERGNVRSQVEDYGGMNLTTTYSYDAKGQQVLEEDMRGVLTLREYNALGWLAEETQDFTVDASGLNLSTTYTYDESGNATLMVDPRGVQTQRVYDERNQLVREVEDYGGAAAETVMTHDRLGQLAQTTDPTGMVTVSNINGFGWLLAETVDSGQEDIWSGFAYDAVGNNIVRADDNNNVTAYSYDALGRLEETLFADGTYESTTYDARGWVDVFTQRDGSTVQHYYDGLGRTLNRTYSDGGQHNFTYDTVGRVLTAEDVAAGVEETRTYSALGDIETSVQDLGAVSGTVAYSYDYAGGTVDITYPSGEVITRSLDSLGRLDTVQNSAGETVADIDIDDVAGTVSRTYLNGASQVSTLDALQRVESVVSSSTAGTIADYNYTYDAAGNRTAVEKAHLSGSNIYDTYRLNTAHMITGVKYRANSAEYGSVAAFGAYRTFDIDGLGNRTDIDVNGTTYNYGPSDGSQSTDPLNRYTQAGGWSLTYDDNGRITDDGRNSYTWNDASRLESGTGMYGQSFAYTYDAFDRRVKTDIDGTETFFFYDANENVLEEQDSSGTLQRQYVYGEGMDTPLQLVDALNGETYYYHTDALGSVTELTDASGAVAESYEYDVYGDVTIYEDSAGGSEIDFGEGTMQPYLFAARRYDPETENYYNRARYYSPDLGRFLSPDPLGYHDSMNTYQYALNNPMLYTDPTGEFGIKDIGRSVKAVVSGMELSFALFRNRDTVHYEMQKGTDNLTDLVGKVTRETVKQIHDNKNTHIPLVNIKEVRDEEWNKMSKFNSSYHNYPVSGERTDYEKYVSPSGHYEAVFDKDGTLITTPENMGTYNYCSPYSDPTCHIVIDVIPYIIWGNTSEDSTNIRQRLFAPIMNNNYLNITN